MNSKLSLVMMGLVCLAMLIEQINTMPTIPDDDTPIEYKQYKRSTGNELFEFEPAEEEIDRLKRDNDDKDERDNIRKPLIFKRETNVRKPLMFKRAIENEFGVDNEELAQIIQDYYARPRARYWFGP